ncbi:NAD(P)/FAD-dependent oxidoreductase [Variovorax sp. UC122_21]|uniref:NAD(P)/FAD-dependent oxidoreductase n=1 Tax=Variovorax sp. UC122_21 TaxID=3374554 RepID=UPI003756F7C2
MAALVSPSTGIVDSHALMLSLLGDLENAGGMLALKSAVTRADLEAGGIVLTAQDGTRLRCRSVVNAAGSSAPDLARHFGGLATEAVPTAWFAKGNYFTLSGRAPFGRLVYPVPEPGGLGVHLTIDLGGQAKFGPDVQWVNSPDDLVVDPARGEAFYAEVRKYWPALPDGALIPGYAGMRPKDLGPRRSRGRLPHRRTERAWRARPGQPVRHRVAGAHEQPRDRPPRGGPARDRGTEFRADRERSLAELFVDAVLRGQWSL